MRICKLEFQNFRGIKVGEVFLPPHGVLLGANNAGKSTVVEGLALLCGRERLYRPVTDWDFNGGDPKPDSRFKIIATITDFGSKNENDPQQFPDWFCSERAGTPVWWIEETATVSINADPPPGGRLATQIAVAARYDDEACEFETVRYFYRGEDDPFDDEYSRVSSGLLRELGVFLLPGNRDWDRLLSFGSSSFLKLVREYDALPGAAIERLKQQLRFEVEKIEEQDPFSTVVQAAVAELQSFLLVEGGSRIAYRPTSLDVNSVLQSLVPHVIGDDDSLLPVSRFGAGVIALQSFLLVLAFSEYRRQAQKNFIFLAEEPELHLHPALHERLVHRIRSVSTQSIVTTQSPRVAAAYQPQDAIYLRNLKGTFSAKALRRESVQNISTNSIKKLYLRYRPEFYEALMGGVVIVPEGETDYHWLALWLRIAQSSPDALQRYQAVPVSIVPTQDAAISQTFEEIHQFRNDAVPIIDGDLAGDGYEDLLLKSGPPPSVIIRYGSKAAVECLSAHILEPSLTNPGQSLQKLLGTSIPTLSALQQALVGVKKERALHEELAWEALEVPACCIRAGEFWNDVTMIATRRFPINSEWKKSDFGSCRVFRAEHIKRV